jgi:hypothetical protein
MGKIKNIGAEKLGDVISLSEAAKIIKDLTGKSFGRDYVSHMIRGRYNYLGVFAANDPNKSGVPTLTGVNRRRFEYFVKARLVCRGMEDTFCDPTRDGIG